MEVSLQYGNEHLLFNLPDDSIIYKSEYKSPGSRASDMLRASLCNPVSGKVLNELLETRRKGDVVVVVSDITRPVPYREFLPALTGYIEAAGVKKEEIIILVATGMHRAITKAEQIEMFGDAIVNGYRIINHNSADDRELIQLEGYSWSGAKVRLNRHYVRAGFRIITGLVEPHFMAGFSGGRKAICPGLVSLDAVRNFHGYKFLSNPCATTAILGNNPCHLESESVARLCPPDYAINAIVDNNKKINALISGELTGSHRAAVDFVRNACCPSVQVQADLVITSSGGFPLDTTFYQCVKGFVGCLPALKDNGEIITFGSCTDGIGSTEYSALMKRYSGNYLQFNGDIKDRNFFIKDQWQFQMHIKALAKTSQQNLHFYTSNIGLAELSQLSVNPHFMHPPEIQRSIQKHIDRAVREKRRIAIFPEGPYCAPVLNV